MKIRLKLQDRAVDGLPCPFPVVTLHVRDKHGTLAELDFRVDTQADFTVIPLAIAQRNALSFSEENRRRVLGLAGEVETFRGRVQIVLAGREHDWPCEFVKLPVRSQSG